MSRILLELFSDLMLPNEIANIIILNKEFNKIAKKIKIFASNCFVIFLQDCYLLCNINKNNEPNMYNCARILYDDEKNNTEYIIRKFNKRIIKPRYVLLELSHINNSLLKYLTSPKINKVVAIIKNTYDICYYNANNIKNICYYLMTDNKLFYNRPIMELFSESVNISIPTNYKLRRRPYNDIKKDIISNNISNINLIIDYDDKYKFFVSKTDPKISHIKKYMIVSKNIVIDSFNNLKINNLFLETNNLYAGYNYGNADKSIIDNVFIMIKENKQLHEIVLIIDIFKNYMIKSMKINIPINNDIDHGQPYHSHIYIDNIKYDDVKYDDNQYISSINNVYIKIINSGMNNVCNLIKLLKKYSPEHIMFDLYILNLNSKMVLTKNDTLQYKKVQQIDNIKNIKIKINNLGYDVLFLN